MKKMSRSKYIWVECSTSHLYWLILEPTWKSLLLILKVRIVPSCDHDVTSLWEVVICILVYSFITARVLWTKLPLLVFWNSKKGELSKIKPFLRKSYLLMTAHLSGTRHMMRISLGGLVWLEELVCVWALSSVGWIKCTNHDFQNYGRHCWSSGLSCKRWSMQAISYHNMICGISLQTIKLWYRSRAL